MKYSAVLFLFVVSVFTGRAPAAGDESPEQRSVFFTPSGWKGMVVADDRSAAQWGADVLEHGGNAVDAAVATAFALAVTRPHFAALGGGGFLVFCPAPKGGQKGDCAVIDFREKAPIKSTQDMYLVGGKADTALSQKGALASGTPGIPAGLAAALERFGTVKLGKTLAQPIRWAEQGIRVSTHTETALRMSWDNFNPAARKIFSCGSQPMRPCKAGEQLIQKDLARTLALISKKGAAGFYKGVTARRIAKAMSRDGGILTEADLASYRPSDRKPLTGSFKDSEVVTMPPPSSGGLVLLQLLKDFERAAQDGLIDKSPASVHTRHTLLHAMSLAFADRTQHMGDSDFYPVPIEQLLSESYLKERWKGFQRERAALPESPGNPAREADQTTHLSVTDADGNAVAMTLTVNGYFGSGYVPDGTGVVMNNEMDDFSLQPGVPNLFGLVGSEANAIAPNKRPLSSMTPTIIRDSRGHVRFVLGAAGGPRIITSVFQTIIHRMHFGLSLSDAVAAPRIHHQWRPKTVFFEAHRLSPDALTQLAKLGYKLQAKDGLAVMHALERSATGQVFGAPDPRGEGAAVAQ